MSNIKTTNQKNYTERLKNKQFLWWKKVLNVQAPYRWNIRRMDLGFVLDIGCGIGRNLLHLDKKGVGIDHNESSVAFCKQKGIIAFTSKEFEKTKYNTPESFDSILLAHVAEHMNQSECSILLKKYYPLIKKNGKIVIITPQEAGFRSDQTHVEFMDFEKITKILENLDMKIIKTYSFPFPRSLGKFFKYNEFVTIAEKQS